MTFMTQSAEAVPASGSSLLARLSGLAAAFSDYMRMRRGMAELRALSPDMLKDIGIDRREIDRYARFGR